MKKQIVAQFETRQLAEQAARDLGWEGIPGDHIRVIAAEGEGELLREEIERNSRTLNEGSAQGMAWGAFFGGLLGWFSGTGSLMGVANIGSGIAGLLVGVLIGAVIGGVFGAIVAGRSAEPEQKVIGEQTLVIVEADSIDSQRICTLLEVHLADSIQVLDVFTPVTATLTDIRSRAYADHPPQDSGSQERLEKSFRGPFTD